MSRSYKKKAIIKDSGLGFKALGNRKLRRKSKQVTTLMKCTGKDCDHSTCDYEDPFLLPYDKSEVVNDYNVCDWKFEVTKKNCKKVNKAGKLRK